MENDIIAAIEKNQRFRDAKELTIVLNGEALCYRDKVVYASLSFAKNSDGMMAGRFACHYVETDNTGKPRCINCTAVVSQRIRNAVTSSELYGVSTKLICSTNMCSIEIDSDLQMLFIEGAIYHTVKMLIANGYTSSSGQFIRANGTEMTTQETIKLVNNFKQVGLVNYAKLVFFRRFRTKVAKANSFLQIQKSFIPVYIDCSYLYNPLKMDSSLHFMDSTLYKESEKRVVEVLPGGTLVAHMMTHLEICRALGMHNFMRFTPALLYSVVVGLLVGDSPNFPNLNLMVMHNPDAEVRKFMSIEDWQVEYGVVQKHYQEEPEGTQHKYELEAQLAELSSYTQRDSLYAFCERVAGQLAAMEPVALDDEKNKTPASYYRYLKEAKITF